MVRLGEARRQRAFFREIDLWETRDVAIAELRALEAMAVQKGLNIEDLNLKHAVLIDTLHDWRSLHAKATKYLKGSLVLRDKYPEEMAGEGRKLHAYYAHVRAKLGRETDDIRSQIEANDRAVVAEEASSIACAADVERQRRKLGVLQNKIADCREFQRHCLFARSLWQPSPLRG